jgi:hypothetical protein
VTFTAADPAAKGFQALLEDGEMSYRHRERYEFGQNELIAAQRASYSTDWRTTVSRAVIVNPPDDVPMIQVYVEPGLVDWDLVAKVETTLSYDDPGNSFHAERTFLVDPTFKRTEWTVRLTDPTIAAYKVKHTWYLKDARQIDGPAHDATAAQVFVPDPFVDRIPVVVQPEVDGQVVARITVDFHYADPDNQLDFHKLVELVGPTFRSQVVNLPVVDPDKRGFTYTAALFKIDGTAQNWAEVATEVPTVIVRDGGAPFTITVQLIGDLAANHFSALEVDLRAQPLDGVQAKEESHLFQPGGDNKWVQALTIRVDLPARAYQYRTTVFLPDRDPVQSDWTDAEGSILPLQLSRLLPS